jgi:DNA-binding NarL/FixJ family response regulator
VVALTSVLEDASVTGAIKAEAIGYLLKTTDADELCEAIRAAAAGQVQLAPEAAARLMHEEVRVPESPEALTERETEVLELIAHVKTDNRIAHELFIGEATVKSHVHIISKLNVSSRTQAALYAVSVDLVPAEFVRLLTYLFIEVLDGRNAHLADGVQRALGREPQDFADYARDAAATGVWDGG